MEAILMQVVAVGAMLAGSFLAVVLGAPVIGITWDMLANRAARARGSAGLTADVRVAAELAGEPVFLRDSWYGRLVLQAYGTDRGWVVFLRRLFFRTGFQYEAGPEFPRHQCPTTGTCATCAEWWNVTFAAYRARKREAYRSCIATLHRPPFQQPFSANAPDGNVCPTFWSVIFAAWVYVLGVWLPKVLLAATLFVAMGSISAVVVGSRLAARLVVAAFRALSVRYGRRVAVACAGLAWGLTVYAGASLANAGVKAVWHAYSAWQVQHVAEMEAAISEKIAASEFGAHAVERAFLEEQYETTVTLAALWFLDQQRDARIADRRSECDTFMQHAVHIPHDTAPAAWVVSRLRSCGETRYHVNKAWIDDARVEYNGQAYRDFHWWEYAQRGWWEFSPEFGPFSSALMHGERVGIIADDADRRGVLDRVLVEVEYLTLGDADAQRVVFASYAAMAQRVRAVLTARLDARERTFAIPAFDGSQDVAWSWSHTHCWSKDDVWKSNGVLQDWGPHEQRPATVVCAPSSEGFVCRVPDAMCAHAAAAIREANEARRAAHDRVAAAEREADRRRWEEYRRIELPARAALFAYLTALRDEPVALYAILQQSCAQSADDRWHAWYGAAVSSGTCSDAAEMFADAIATAQRYQWFVATRDAVVGWWNAYAWLMGIALAFGVGYIACAYALTVLALRLGVADVLVYGAHGIACLACAAWNVPMVIATRAAIAAFAYWCCWFVWQPFRGIGLTIRAVAHGVRDAAILLWSFARAWYEKRCYQITWQ